MKKSFVILSLISILILTFSLTACHKSNAIDAFQIPEEFDTSRNYEITFWAKNDSNNEQKKIYQNAIDSFEALYPNITVTMKSYTDYTSIYNDVITNIATSTTPNVCITYPDHVATYLTGNNIIVKLDDLMEDYKYGFGGADIRFDSVKSDELIDEFMEECYLDDGYYCIPYMRSSEACYINKTYIDNLAEKYGAEYALPEKLTWDYIWKVCKLAMKDKSSSQTLIPFIYKSTDNMMIQMLRQKNDDESINGNYSTANGNILIFNDTTKEILEYIDDLTKVKGFSTFARSSYPGNFLNAGQCIFAIDSTAGATWMGSEAPLLDIHSDQVADFEMVVMEIPQYDTENPKMISQGPSLCIFNKEDSQEVLASWLFAQYLLTNDTQIAYSETEGYVPVTKKAQNSAEYLEYLSKEGETYTYTDAKGETVEDNSKYYAPKIQASKIVLKNIANTFTTPVFNGSASLRSAAGELIEELVNSRYRKETINDAYYTNLFNNVSQLYKLDQIEVKEEASSSVSSKKNLGPLGGTAIALISVLCAGWAGMGIYVLIGKLKSKK